jgi:hypothetical protein
LKIFAVILEPSRGARNRVGIGLVVPEPEYVNSKEPRNRFQ